MNLTFTSGIAALHRLMTRLLRPLSSIFLLTNRPAAIDSVSKPTVAISLSPTTYCDGHSPTLRICPLAIGGFPLTTTVSHQSIPMSLDCGHFHLISRTLEDVSRVLSP